LDEVFIRINGKQHYLWRAVDQDGIVLDVLVQTRPSAGAAKRFFKRLLKGLLYVPRVLITDKLKSYGVAQRELLPDVEHWQSRYLNNRSENSHRPTRRRERQMQRFKSPGAGATVPLGSLLHLRSLSTATPSVDGMQLSEDALLGLRGLAGGGVCAECGMTALSPRSSFRRDLFY
jgi:transposase-like protein